jgi:isoquinoline 1-oxidoreductase beta subunit
MTKIAATKIRKSNVSLNRRQAMGGIGASASALVFGFALPLTPSPASAGTTATAITAWIAIDVDESIIIQIGAQEMGQGIMSGLAQVAASELMVDWTKVRAHTAKADPKFANPMTHAQFTGGSTSMRGFYQAMRVAGATVREMLKQAAANRWGVSISSVKAAHGAVTDGGSQSLTYGQLAFDASKLSPPSSPPLLGSSLIGKSVPRVDIPTKLNGSAVFGIDVRVPNMLYAAVKQCPVFGGTLPPGYVAPKVGIATVPLDNAVAVVSNDTYSAIRGARSLKIDWVLPPDASDKDSAAVSAAAQQLMLSGSPAVAESQGSALSDIAASPRKLDVTYSLPYLAHACMEPLNCTVSVTAKRCDIWAPTQAPGNVAATAASLTGLPAKAIHVNTTYMGGGLGRKFEMDYVVQAIRVAMAVKRPVKLTWSREEDFTHDQYRPMALIRIRAGLDASGNITGWANRIVSPSILYQRWPGLLVNGVDSQAVDGAVALDYTFGSRLVEYVRHPVGIPVGFWRSVGHSLNAFSVESAIDELALLAGKDPLAFRQSMLAGNPRGLAVLNAAASLAGWGTSLPAGHARGIAYSVGFGSIVAQVAEVSATATSIRVHKVACAIDCGQAINPNSVTAQMEGAIAHGLAAALWGNMTFTKGAANYANFSHYRMLRINEMPQVSVKIVNSGGPIGGVGEPGVPPIAPAVANALAKLTGKRVRSLPFFPGATMSDG